MVIEGITIPGLPLSLLNELTTEPNGNDVFYIVSAGNSRKIKYSTLESFLAGGGGSGSLGVWAAMTNNIQIVSIGATNTRYLVDSWDTAYPSTTPDDFTIDTANGRITYTGTETKWFEALINAILKNNVGGEAGTILFEVHKNGVAIDGTSAFVLSMYDDYVGGAAALPVSLEENDYLEVYVANTASTKDPQVNDLRLVVKELLTP